MMHGQKNIKLQYSEYTGKIIPFSLSHNENSVLFLEMTVHSNNNNNSNRLL